MRWTGGLDVPDDAVARSRAGEVFSPMLRAGMFGRGGEKGEPQRHRDTERPSRALGLPAVTQTRRGGSKGIKAGGFKPPMSPYSRCLRTPSSYSMQRRGCSAGRSEGRPSLCLCVSVVPLFPAAAMLAEPDPERARFSATTGKGARRHLRHPEISCPIE